METPEDEFPFGKFGQEGQYSIYSDFDKYDDILDYWQKAVALTQIEK